MLLREGVDGYQVQALKCSRELIRIYSTVFFLVEDTGTYMRGVRYAMCVEVASDKKSAPQRDSLYLVYEHIESGVTGAPVHAG